MRHGGASAKRADSGGILARLGIRGKLNLLLLPPLVAVVLVSVPFVLTQANSALAATQSATVARHTQQLGGLVWQLQRERLLTGAFVATPSMSADQMLQQQKTVDAAVENVRSSLGSDAPDELSAALTRIGSLTELRQNAQARGVALDSVARTYHAVIGAVIDSLRLVPQLTSDAEGTRELTALEALLRANEENSLRGMALIVTAVSPEAGRSILDDATQQAPIFTDRFVQQADDSSDSEQAALVVNVEQSEAGRRIDDLAARIDNPRDAAGTTQYVTDVLTASESQAGQRKLVQERVTGEIADSATGRADAATRLAWTVGIGAGALFLLVAFLAIAVSRSIAQPLRRLTTAATSVADLAGTELVRVTDTEEAEELAPRLATIDVVSERRARQARRRVQPGPDHRGRAGRAAGAHPAQHQPDVRERRQAHAEPRRPPARADRRGRAQRAGHPAAGQPLPARPPLHPPAPQRRQPARGVRHPRRHAHRRPDRAVHGPALRARRDRGLPARQARRRRGDPAVVGPRRGPGARVRRAAGERDVVLAAGVDGRGRHDDPRRRLVPGEHRRPRHRHDRARRWPRRTSGSSSANASSWRRPACSACSWSAASRGATTWASSCSRRRPPAA